MSLEQMCDSEEHGLDGGRTSNNIGGRKILVEEVLLVVMDGIVGGCRTLTN